MKQKTSITLDRETIRVLDRLARPGSNRSRIIEAAVREYVLVRERSAREARDLEILNRNAEALNREALDALSYQVGL